MARATPTAVSDAPRDAITLLKQDHRTVEHLFDEFDKADEDELHDIAARVCHLLTVHTQIEEEIMYPAAKDAFEDDEDGTELVAEADVEHQAAKDLIAKIEGMPSEDEHFRATVRVLGEYIEHHIKEEEGKLFPKMKRSRIDLKEMGSHLNERKMSLMQQMGIEAEEPPQPARRKRAPSRVARTSGAKARQARAGARKGGARAGGRAARH